MSRYETDDFQADVIERSRTVPVLVDFWAEWCGPCRVLGPVLERLAEASDGRWELAKVDTDRHSQVAGRYGVRSIPNAKLFVDGEVVDEFVGALPEDHVRSWLERALPSPQRRRLAGARDLLDRGADTEAVALLREILAEAPDDEEARALLGRALLFDEPAAALKVVEPIGLGSDHHELVEAVRTLGRLLVLDADSLPEGVAAPRYRDAVEALGRRDLDAALAAFIEVIERDRPYDDDGARRACLAIFRLLGEDHQTSRERRPAFNNAVLA